MSEVMTKTKSRTQALRELDEFQTDLKKSYRKIFKEPVPEFIELTPTVMSILRSHKGLASKILALSDLENQLTAKRKTNKKRSVAFR
jgi:hypothetical protein